MENILKLSTNHRYVSFIEKKPFVTKVKNYTRKTKSLGCPVPKICHSSILSPCSLLDPYCEKILFNIRNIDDSKGFVVPLFFAFINGSIFEINKCRENNFKVKLEETLK